MIVRIIRFLVLATAAISCKKETKEPNPFPPSVFAGYPFNCQDTALDWTPDLFDDMDGQYHTFYGKWSVGRACFDPISSDIIYYVTVEIPTSSGWNLWKLDRKTSTKTKLIDGIYSSYFSISKTGWIAFEWKDSNIYVMRTSGEDLTQVTFDGKEFASTTWSHNGKYLFYRRGYLGPTVYKYDNELKHLVDSFQLIYSDVQEYTNYIFYKVPGSPNNISIVRKNLQNNTVTTIVSREITDNFSEENLRNDFFIDFRGENLYWSGTHGLSKTNLKSLSSKQLINSGVGSNSYFNQFNQYRVDGRMIATCIVDSVPNPLNKYTKMNVWEFSADGKCRQKIDLPD